MPLSLVLPAAKALFLAEAVILDVAVLQATVEAVILQMEVRSVFAGSAAGSLRERVRLLILVALCGKYTYR